jgi:hypothetical protein
MIEILDSLSLYQLLSFAVSVTDMWISTGV